MQLAVNLTIDLDEALGSDAAHNLQPFSNHRSSLLRSKHVYLPITRTVSLARFESQFCYCDSVQGEFQEKPGRLVKHTETGFPPQLISLNGGYSRHKARPDSKRPRLGHRFYAALLKWQFLGGELRFS